MDRVLERLGELFQGANRIPNPYSLSDNNKRLLINGYGLIVGPANFEQFEFCNFVVSRSLTIVLTKEVPRLDSQTDLTDTIVKELLENVYELQKAFYAYNELDIEEDILKVDISSVSGIEAFLNDKQNFLSMTAEFTFQIKEDF